MKTAILFLIFGVVAIFASSRTLSSHNHGVFRSITFQTTNPDEFDVRLVRANGTELDAILIKIATNWIPRFVLRYFEKSTDSADLFGSRWVLWKIVEYIESGNEEGFQPGNDTVASSLHLWGTTWNAMYYTHQTQADGSTIYNVCSNLTDPTATVTVCVHLTTQATNTSDGHHFDPNSIKWSVDISNYAFTDSNSLLALKVSFDTVDAVKNFTNTSAAGAGFTGDVNTEGILLDTDSTGQYSSFAQWVTSVDVTGTGCDLTADVVKSVVRVGQWEGDVDTIPTDPDTDSLSASVQVQVAYYSFITTPATCRPTDILWDPTFGVTSPNSAVSALPMIFLIALLIFSLF